MKNRLTFLRFSFALFAFRFTAKETNRKGREVFRKGRKDDCGHKIRESFLLRKIHEVFENNHGLNIYDNFHCRLRANAVETKRNRHRRKQILRSLALSPKLRDLSRAGSERQGNRRQARPVAALRRHRKEKRRGNLSADRQRKTSDAFVQKSIERRGNPENGQIYKKGFAGKRIKLKIRVRTICAGEWFTADELKADLKPPAAAGSIDYFSRKLIR